MNTENRSLLCPYLKKELSAFRAHSPFYFIYIPLFDFLKAHNVNTVFDFMFANKGLGSLSAKWSKAYMIDRLTEIGP